MKLPGRKTPSSEGRSAGLLEEIERLGRRLRALPIIGLLLIGGGLGAGQVTTRWLDLPEDRPVRTPTAEAVPQIYLRSLSRNMERLRGDGDNTLEYVTLYQDHVEPVEKTLIKRGVPAVTARKVAWPLVEHAYRREIDPATVIAIMLVESGGKPSATSPVGARGLMQVMPLWAGNWRACGNDLYDIESNLCHGVNILDYYYKSNGGDERRALLGYNGCVRGTNTPNCHTYPDKVDRLRQQVSRDIRLAGGGRTASRPFGAAAP